MTQAAATQVLSGARLRLFEKIDAMLAHWAGALGAEEFRFPGHLSAAELAKIDYLRSFPHQATFPATLDPAPENLRAFVKGKPVAEDGEVRFEARAPVRDVLTPAACYPFYPHFSGRAFDGPAYVTTRAACWRREDAVVPLERQWNFTMREIVCFGTVDETRAFLDGMRQRLAALFATLGFEVEWTFGSDMFFDPQRNPRAFFQKNERLKTEMTFKGRLNIGSLNDHLSSFGEAFGIERAGRPAFSACAAFGLERWVAAFVETFGDEEDAWPSLS